MFPWFYLIFPWFYSILPLFYSIFPWFYSIFSIFLRFYSTFPRILFLFPIVYSIFPWFTQFSNGFARFFHYAIVFPWFYSTSPPFYASIPVSPNAPRRTDQRGVDTPPSPNCHLAHNPQKSSNCHASTAPNSVILRCPRPLYPRPPITHFVRKRNFA